MREPDYALQEKGTEVEIHYRGAVTVPHSTNPSIAPSPLTDAEAVFDDYGVTWLTPMSASSVGTPTPWTSNPKDLETGLQPTGFKQLRSSFISNADQNHRSMLNGFGLVYDFD